MYHYLLFDLDGTLTDSQEGITKSVDHALRTIAGIETADLSTLTPYIGPPLVDGFMENHHLDHDTAVRCKDAYRARYEKIGLFENRVYDGIPAALARLQAAGCTLALATSKPEVFAVRILEHFDLSRYFTVICGATMDGRISQKDEVIDETLRRLGNPSPDDTIMIGDRRHDVLGAKRHGLRCLGVRFGFGSEAELREAGAYALAATPQDMADWLLKDA
ncbi:MAG: HAD hydrolase-like protein [Butyricicoccus sp.]